MKNQKTWDEDPISSFATFIHSAKFMETSRRLGKQSAEPISVKSAAVYTFMFGKFAAWLAQANRLFSAVDDQDLIRFVSQLRQRGEQNSGITARYLRLLERCYTFLEVTPNPAALALKRATDNKYLAHDTGTEALTEQQIADFIAALPPLELPMRNRAGRPPKAWKRRRDHALQATMLFGGLKVSEIIGLHLNEIDASFENLPLLVKIRPEDKHDTSYQHTTIVHAYGAEALRRWLIERQETDARGKPMFAGDLVFPGGHDGRPMSKVTLWRQVKATFERAGIDVNRSGGRTLRNTFAKQQLTTHGRTKSDLKEYLGLALERSAQIYETAQPRKIKVDEAV